VEFSGSEAVDLPTAEGRDPDVVANFKGNMDTAALESFITSRGAAAIPLVMITVTNNSGGGQPVSMKNIRETKAICAKHGIPFFLDACRFAENAYFIKLREPGYSGVPVRDIAREIFSYADGATMSAKKDAIVNMGGFLAMNDGALAQRARNLLIITEGFPTYGGLAGRDLEAIAQGLDEVLDEHYLQYRIRSVEYLGEKLIAGGVPILRPPGGHAIYLNARTFLPHIPVDQYPGQSLSVELFRMGGIRSVEIGSVMFGKYDPAGRLIPARMELVRLAIPRRVYTQSHIDYVIEVVLDCFRRREELRGYEIVEEAPVLRHFTARFRPKA
jgi:tryptophanase